ncbi:MAG: TonB family protein [Campylobacterales bacterium]
MMFSVVMAARGTRLDSLKFILFSFLVHMFVVVFFWNNNDAVEQISLSSSISLSAVVIEKSENTAQKQQQKAVEKIKPIENKVVNKKEHIVEKPVETTKDTKSEPIKQSVQAAASAQTKETQHIKTAAASENKAREAKHETESEASYTADYLNNPKPSYPSISRRLGETGTVHLRVYVMPDGTVGQVSLYKSCGFPRLDDCALSTVKKWRFSPAKKGNLAVASWVNVPVDFKLEKGA